MQAYWNVATKRLVDNVCMTMEQDFVVKLLGKVESELFLLTNRFTDVEELFVEVKNHFFFLSFFVLVSSVFQSYPNKAYFDTKTQTIILCFYFCVRCCVWKKE